ncbi:hypothetical protein GCM10023213_11260 [Prosthecobacter algae]|uniref:Uncharacterized protein n=1 Tax=Prosthecobacter algae TaxID=1144682 RepID=A0ABP9P0T0_9BACT
MKRKDVLPEAGWQEGPHGKAQAGWQEGPHGKAQGGWKRKDAPGSEPGRDVNPQGRPSKPSADPQPTRPAGKRHLGPNS